MSITHKILVSKETGRIIEPVYPIDDPRPEPLDCKWIELVPGTAAHKCYVTNEDVSHLDMAATYWDFETGEWVEVPTSSVPSKARTKYNRNELLKSTDRVFATCTDPEEIALWLDYRQKLRTMFDNLPEDFDYNMIVFPRNPADIRALREKAAAGDQEAIEIIKRDGL